MDFVHDALTDGRPFRILTVVDQWSRSSPLLEVASRMLRHTVGAALDRVLGTAPRPRSITVDHGTEFQSRALEDWAYQRGVRLDFIRPGKPVENAFIESLNGRLRDECSNVHQFASIADAQATELSECLTLSRDALRSFVDSHPWMMHRVIQVLIGYVRATDETFSETAFLDIPGRVAKKLLELAESHGERRPDGVRIRLRLTQRTFAGMVAASRENVNRALARFETSGAIRQDGGYITITHPEKLRVRA